jgi:hypothetical protein
MALRDKIVARLDGAVPTKDRVLEVEVSSPGGTVDMEISAGILRLTESSRTGKMRNWKVATIEHVVSVEFIAGK